MTLSCANQIVVLCSAGATAALLALPTPLAEIQQEVQHHQSVHIKAEPSMPQSEPATDAAPRRAAKPDEKPSSVALRPDSSMPLNVPSLLEPTQASADTADASLGITEESSAVTSQPQPEQPATKSELPENETKEAQAEARPAIGTPSRLTTPVLVPESSKEQPGEQNLLVLPLIEHTNKPITADAKTAEQTAKEPPPLPEEEEVPDVPPPVIGKANRVTVPSIQIDMPVKTGVYDKTAQTWQVDESSAFHADTTVPVNDSNGTTLIYGHAKWGIFGNLPDVSDGAEAIVYTDEGKRFVYAFESVRQVDPSDVSLLKVDGTPKLMLQTCSGLFDQHRTLAIFQLKEVLSA